MDKISILSIIDKPFIYAKANKHDGKTLDEIFSEKMGQLADDESVGFTLWAFKKNGIPNVVCDYIISTRCDEMYVVFQQTGRDVECGKSPRFDFYDKEYLNDYNIDPSALCAVEDESGNYLIPKILKTTGAGNTNLAYVIEEFFEIEEQFDPAEFLSNFSAFATRCKNTQPEPFKFDNDRKSCIIVPDSNDLIRDRKSEAYLKLRTGIEKPNFKCGIGGKFYAARLRYPYIVRIEKKNIEL